MIAEKFAGLKPRWFDWFFGDGGRRPKILRSLASQCTDLGNEAICPYNCLGETAHLTLMKHASNGFLHAESLVLLLGQSFASIKNVLVDGIASVVLDESSIQRPK